MAMRFPTDYIRRTWAKRGPFRLALLLAFLSRLYYCDAEAQSDKSLETLVSILRDRTNTILAAIDQQTQELDDRSLEAQPTITKLKALRKQFYSLFEEHITAVKENNMLLEHELANTMNDVLSQIKEAIRERWGAIGDEMINHLPRAYITPPNPGVDPAYDAVMREIARMNAKVDAISKSLVYPGPPDVRVPFDLSKGVFVTPQPSPSPPEE